MTDDQPPDDNFRLTNHARLVIERRGINKDWIRLTLAEPSATEPDKIDPAISHALRPIPEFGGRVLRIVYNPAETPPLVITAFFDRSRKGTL